MQLELDKTILAGNWQVAGQTRTSVDQTWQPVYGERSLVTNRYNELNCCFVPMKTKRNDIACPFV